MPTPTEPKSKPETEQESKVKAKQFRRKSDGETYDVTVHPPAPIHARTHKAVNEKHVWEGTKEQFIRDFDRADGSPLIPDLADL